MLCLFLGLLLTSTPVHGSSKLHSYHVDTSKVSVSGISSGAAMATQYHVIHSREVMGVGMVAGIPFACSQGILATGLLCMSSPSMINVFALEAETSSGALFGNADATYHMRHDKVYIFDGTEDTVVKPAIGHKIDQFYGHYISSSNIKTVFNIHAEHSMPTKNYGGPCNKLNEVNYLNNCNYSAAFHLLDHIYGGLREPTTSTKAKGQLLQFDQSEFFYLSGPATYSMDSVGYIYVPSGCTGHNKCKLHVAFHGCKMGRKRIGDAYVRHGGYNEVGELNNIIILYPQVIPIVTNPQGCWDWFGYTGTLFATNKGFQITAVRRMIERVTGSSSGGIIG